MMDGKAGLVTGGGAGIGQATALAFGRAGARVMVSDVDSAAGEQTVELIRALGAEADFFRCDISNNEQVEELVAATVARFGQVDFAFNNAGVSGLWGPLADIEVEEWDQVVNVNLNGTFYCLKHEINAMVKTGGGAIVNTASGAGLTGVANHAHYVSSKFGVVGLTKSAALDYADRGVRVNAIAPGPTLTAMMKNAFEQNPPEYRERVLSRVPMHVLSEPEDQANAVVWLCSDAARMITGVALPVDGGWMAGK